MNRRIRASSALKVEERFHRFLRPGALARLRDARIRPRSATALTHTTPAAPSPPSSPAPAEPAIPGSPPCFTFRAYGPRFPQRKKLLAAKAMAFLGVQTGVEAAESLLDSIGADLLVAH